MNMVSRSILVLGLLGAHRAVEAMRLGLYRVARLRIGNSRQLGLGPLVTCAFVWLMFGTGCASMRLSSESERRVLPSFNQQTMRNKHIFWAPYSPDAMLKDKAVPLSGKTMIA